MAIFNVFTKIFGLFLIAAVATANPVEGKRFQDWGANCERVQQQEICYLQQILSDKGKPLMVTVIGYTQGKKYPTIFFELPNNVDTNTPIALKIGKRKPIHFDANCTKEKCTTGFSLDARMLRRLRKAYQAKLTYTSIDKKLNVLPVSLMGITVGLKAVR